MTSRVGDRIFQGALLSRISIVVIAGALTLILFWTVTDSLLYSHLTHSWSSVDIIPASHPPDAAIRQAWVRARPRQALGRVVLPDAIAVQNQLLQGCPSQPVCDVPVAVPRSTYSSGIDRSTAHSLRDGIAIACNDKELMKVLRPELILSEFVWSRGRVVSADALAITLISDHDSYASVAWDEATATLFRNDSTLQESQRYGDRIEPEHIRVQCRWASSADAVAFFAAYSVIAIYAWDIITRRSGVRNMSWMMLCAFIEVRFQKLELLFFKLASNV
jgi:hypothetical protein